MILKSQTK